MLNWLRKKLRGWLLEGMGDMTDRRLLAIEVLLDIRKTTDGHRSETIDAIEIDLERLVRILAVEPKKISMPNVVPRSRLDTLNAAIVEQGKSFQKQIQWLADIDGNLPVLSRDGQESWQKTKLGEAINELRNLLNDCVTQEDSKHFIGLTDRLHVRLKQLESPPGKRNGAVIAPKKRRKAKAKGR